MYGTWYKCSLPIRLLCHDELQHGQSQIVTRDATGSVT